MRTIERLKIEARDAALWRGHTMTRFSHYTPENAVSHCTVCPAEVQVLSRPAANEIDIGGNAVALNCPIGQGED